MSLRPLSGASLAGTPVSPSASASSSVSGTLQILPQSPPSSCPASPKLKPSVHAGSSFIPDSISPLSTSSTYSTTTTIIPAPPPWAYKTASTITQQDAPLTTRVLAEMTRLIVTQGRLMKNTEVRLARFEEEVNNHFERMEGKVRVVRASMAGLTGRKEVFKQKLDGLVGKVEDARHTRGLNDTSDKIMVASQKHDRVRPSWTSQGICKRKGKAVTKGKGKVKGSTVQPKRDIWIPSTSVLALTPFSEDEDEPPTHDLYLGRRDNYQTHEAGHQPSFIPAKSTLHAQVAVNHQGDAGPSNHAGMSLVETAVEAERLRLADHDVLAEGENTVDFRFRRRAMKRKRGDFVIDTDFLDDISIDAEDTDFLEEYTTRSRLSSGIESLPDSFMSPPPDIPLQPSLAGPSTYMQQGREASWQPFPSTFLRQGTVTPALSSNSDWSEDTHLTAVRRGASLVEDQVLLPSLPSQVKGKWGKFGNGRRKKRGQWPKFGINTIKSRMQEIMCDMCTGRVHFACAGLAYGRDMSKTPWSCPDCLYRVSRRAAQRGSLDDGGDDPIEVPRAQQERCLREDCIYQSGRKIVRKNGDVQEFLMERIVGRKRLRWEANGQAVYTYLVKWYDWEVYDSTWEPASHIPNLAREEAFFLQQVKRKDLDDPLLSKIVLLPETEMFFDHKGNYKIDVLEKLGVERRWWWEDQVERMGERWAGGV